MGLFDYFKTLWEDDPSHDTPITADNLNKMENGIAQANQGLAALPGVYGPGGTAGNIDGPTAQGLQPRNAMPSYSPRGLNTYDPVRNVYNLKPSNTQRTRAGFGRAMTGGVSAHLVLGDSLSEGWNDGVSSPGVVDRLRSWSMQMRAELARHGIPIGGTGLIRNITGAAFDPRWAYTGTWAGANSYTSSSAGASTATLTPDLTTFTACEVWFYDSAGGTFTIGVNGATSGSNNVFTTVVSTGTAGWKRVTLNPGSAITSLVITISSGLCILSGANLYTPNGGLVVHNVAQGGSRATGSGATCWSDYSTAASLGLVYKDVAGNSRAIADGGVTSGSTTLTSSTGFSDSFKGTPILEPTGQHYFPSGTYIADVINAGSVTLSQPAAATGSGVSFFLGYYPDAVHLALGANDKPGTVTTFADQVAALAAIAASYSHSDIFLYLTNQENSATQITDANWEGYGAALYALADSLDCPLFDLRHRFGNYLTASGHGLYGDGVAHLFPAGYADWGRNVGLTLSS